MKQQDRCWTKDGSQVEETIALVFVNANENLNRVVAVRTETKEQMGELVWKKLLCSTVTILHIIKYVSG